MNVTETTTFHFHRKNIELTNIRMNIDRILIDLEVIAQLQPDDKLGVNVLPGSTELVVDSNYYTQSIRRWYGGRDRRTALNYVDRLVTSCEEAAGTLRMGSHTVAQHNITQSITKAVVGLENLKQTYVNDSVLVAQLSLILCKLEVVLRILSDHDCVE